MPGQRNETPPVSIEEIARLIRELTRLLEEQPPEVSPAPIVPPKGKSYGWTDRKGIFHPPEEEEKDEATQLALFVLGEG